MGLGDSQCCSSGGVDIPSGHQLRFSLQKNRQKAPELVPGLPYSFGWVVNHLEYGQSCLQGAPAESSQLQLDVKCSN